MATDLQLTRADIEALPNFKKKTMAGEFSATCPICGGVDRFLYWETKSNFWCRQCEVKGFVIDGNTLTFNREDYQRWQTQETERRRVEEKNQLSALERLEVSGRVAIYHKQMKDRSYWYGQGLEDETIDWFQLGYAPACPTYPGSASYTIPITYRGKLYNIRHRLATPNGSGKYRPEIAGLPAAMFNADSLNNGEWMVCLVEGEIKAAVLEQQGFNAVGIPGASSFKDKWVKLFNPKQAVFVALDPGAENQAIEIGQSLKGNGIQVKVCYMPVKPDDMFVRYGATKSEFMKFLMLGEKV